MSTGSTDLKTLMDQTGLKYQMDDDGDARVTFTLPDGRDQMAWVSGTVDDFGPHADRDVYSYIAKLSDVPKSFEVLETLLRHTARKKMGGIVIIHETLTYRIDVSTSAGAEGLKAAIIFAVKNADELEKALTGKDDH